MGFQGSPNGKLIILHTHDPEMVFFTHYVLSVQMLKGYLTGRKPSFLYHAQLYTVLGLDILILRGLRLLTPQNLEHNSRDALPLFTGSNYLPCFAAHRSK